MTDDMLTIAYMEGQHSATQTYRARITLLEAENARLRGELQAIAAIPRSEAALKEDGWIVNEDAGYTKVPDAAKAYKFVDTIDEMGNVNLQTPVFMFVGCLIFTHWRPCRVAQPSPEFLHDAEGRN